MDVDIISTRALHVVDTQVKLTDREVCTHYESTELCKIMLFRRLSIPPQFIAALVHDIWTANLDTARAT